MLRGPSIYIFKVIRTIGKRFLLIKIASFIIPVQKSITAMTYLQHCWRAICKSDI